MKIGIYGGSFDPIHRGHIDPILEAREAVGLEKVIYLPTARPPHKQDRLLATAEARFTMVEMALLDYPELEVCNHEMERSGPAYTVETLEHFARQYPSDRCHLLIGADSFIQLHRWRRYREIPKLAQLVVMMRPGWDLEASNPSLEIRRLLESVQVIFVENQEVPASSTEIRRRLGAMEALPAHWVSESVLKYIEKYGLYRPIPGRASEEMS